MQNIQVLALVQGTKGGAKKMLKTQIDPAICMKTKGRMT